MPESESAAEPASRPRPPRITRGEWAVLLVLVALHFTHMVDFVIIMPLGGRLMSELEINPTQFGWIVSVYALAAGLASLVASLFMDRFDRKSVLLTMYAGFGVSTLYCGLAESYASLLVARTLAGVFGGLAAVTIVAMIGDLFPNEKRGRAMGAITSSFAVASIAGLPIGLLLAEWYGRGAPFLVLAGLSAAVWVVAALKLPPVREHLEHERRHPLAEFAAVLKEPNHQRAYLFSFFMVLGAFTVGSFSAPYLSATNGWGEGELARIYFAAGVCTLLGMNFVGSLADRVPRLLLFRIMGTCALLMGVVLTTLPPTPLWVAAAALSAFMVFSAGRIVPAQAMMIGSAQPRVRGAFMSLNTAVQHLATGIAPVLAGSIVTQTEDGKISGFWIVGLVAAAAAAAALVLAGGMRPAVVPQPLPTPKPAAEESEREAEPAAVA